MRATLAHVEAALEGHEAELRDSWHALRQQAEQMQSHAELTPEMLQPDASARVKAPLPLPCGVSAPVLCPDWLSVRACPPVPQRCNYES